MLILIKNNLSMFSVISEEIIMENYLIKLSNSMRFTIFDEKNVKLSCVFDKGFYKVNQFLSKLSEQLKVNFVANIIDGNLMCKATSKTGFILLDDREGDWWSVLGFHEWFCRRSIKTSLNVWSLDGNYPMITVKSSTYIVYSISELKSFGDKFPDVGFRIKDYTYIINEIKKGWG